MATLGRIFDQYESPLLNTMRAQGVPYDSPFQKTLRSLSGLGQYDSSLQKTLKSLRSLGQYDSSLQETLNALKGLVHYDSSLQKTLKSLRGLGQYDSSFQKALKSLEGLNQYDSSIQKALKSLDGLSRYDGSIQRAIKSLGTLGRYESSAIGNNAESAIIEQTIASLSRMESFQDAISSLAIPPNNIENRTAIPEDPDVSEKIETALKKIYKISVIQMIS